MPHRHLLIKAAALAMLAGSPAAALDRAPVAASAEAAALAQLDARQKDMVARADADGLAALSSPDLRINAPTGRILTRDQFIAMMRNGQIAAEAFERTIDSASITGDVGVVMGHEVFTPTAASELGRMYGAKPLNRRYTNIYIQQGGKWLWLARHANVEPQGAGAAR